MCAEFESSLLDTLSDVFLGFDESGTLVVWNDAAVDVTGYDESTLAETTVHDLFEKTDVDEHVPTAETLLSSDETVIEARLVTAHGERIPYEFTATRVTEDGPVAVAGLACDVTERRLGREQGENQERVLREMYEIIADRERSFEEQVGALLALGREELGTAYGTLSRIDGGDYTFEVVDTADDDNAVQAGDVVPLSETNCELAASNEQTLVLGDVARDAPKETDRAGYEDWGISCYIGAPVYVEDDVYGTFCFYDTTSRTGQFSDWEVTLVDLMSRWVSYELQHKQTTEQLQQQNERLERFTAIASHDLRNPLNVAQGSIELAEETEDPSQLERARTALERMDTLIDDLLTLARAGVAIGETSTVEVAAYCRQSWDGITAADATLVVETTRTVDADGTRFQQLLENLFQNAVDHGGETVTVGDLSSGFYVEDNGPGIPPEERENVFERGYSTTATGTGFGLEIVAEIADAHGWTVDLTDGETGGARFEFTGVSGDTE